MAEENREKEKKGDERRGEDNTREDMMGAFSLCQGPLSLNAD